MKKTLLSLLTALALLGPAVAEPEVRVRGSTYPGGALFISVESEGLTKGTWTWAGHSGKLNEAPYGLRAAVSVPLDASAGGQATLKLTVVDASGEKSEIVRKIKVEDKWRPVQYLSMSSDNESKYTDPQADKEEELVYAALEDMQPGPRWKGDFIEPSDGPRSSPFGVRRVRNGKTAGFHKGLDYALYVGEPIVAPAEGVVTLVGPNFTLLGNCVLINHGEGLCSLYMHLSEIGVRKGDKVKKGQKIGLSGNTGASTGPHLHYATYFLGVPVDPDILLHMPQEWAPDVWK